MSKKKKVVKRKGDVSLKKVDVFKGDDGNFYEKRVETKYVPLGKEEKNTDGIKGLTFDKIKGSKDHFLIKILLAIFLAFRMAGKALLVVGKHNRAKMDAWE